MEKPSTKPKGTVNIFHFLSKPSSLVYIPPHPPYSPRGADQNTCTNKGFVVSLIPAEARVFKGKSSSGAEEEPTSPKVSCTGQIKRKKKKKKQQQQQQPPLPLPCRTSTTTSTLHADRRENDRIFTEITEMAKAPSTVGVGEMMRRFASGREGAAAALREFDWGKVEREMKLDAENGGVVVNQGRKEVNLWKRRAMASRPVPLKLDK